MPSTDDVSYALGLFCERFCKYYYGVDPEKYPISYQECYKQCLDTIDPLEELLKNIVMILEQHGKEIGRIEIDLIKMRR